MESASVTHNTIMVNATANNVAAEFPNSNGFMAYINNPNTKARTIRDVLIFKKETAIV
jgi:hypothetical protein